MRHLLWGEGRLHGQDLDQRAQNELAVVLWQLVPQFGQPQSMRPGQWIRGGIRSAETPNMMLLLETIDPAADTSRPVLTKPTRQS
jgi:hypothetical protein